MTIEIDTLHWADHIITALVGGAQTSGLGVYAGSIYKNILNPSLSEA
jgi:hypothetical protein